MKKAVFIFFLLSTLSVCAVERVSLEALQSNWAKYSNQMVELRTPLVVCGSFYDSLVLAPYRLFCPEEIAEGLADGDSTRYYEIAKGNRDVRIVVHCRNDYYNVRCGDQVTKIVARVTSERHLVTGKPVHTKHVRVPQLPKARKGELRIVGANIENYFADLGGYATKRTTPKQQALKTQKIVKALRQLNADIIACCEMQVGDKAPQMLLKELNKSGKHYAFVTMPLENMDRIGGCILYNTERVRAYEQPLSAYHDTTSHYYGRMFVQGFEDLSNGERFIVGVNHFKSKRAGRGNYDTHLKRMENTDSLLAMLPRAMELYGDSDIILLGDYNCYSQEQPIQTIVRAGYDHVIPTGDSEAYSYSFKGEAGYLDHCFMSASMIRPLVWALPWHVNADWYYSHGAYKLKDKSLHRYADHDPIVVEIKW